MPRTGQRLRASRRQRRSAGRNRGGTWEDVPWAVLQYERIVRARLGNVIPSPYRPIGPELHVGVQETTNAGNAGGAARRALRTLYNMRSSHTVSSACSSAARSAVCVLSVRGSLDLTVGSSSGHALARTISKMALLPVAKATGLA